jgi:hypothetical protein
LLDGEVTVSCDNTINISKASFEKPDLPDIKPNNKSNIKTLKSGGQQAEVSNNGQISVKEVDTLVCSAWKNGKLCFKQTPTHEVIRQLKNWYDVESDYEPDKNSECFHSGSVDQNTSIYGLMKAMEHDCEGLHFNFNATNKKIEVSSK